MGRLVGCPVGTTIVGIFVRIRILLVVGFIVGCTIGIAVGCDDGF